jgi:hypothetical protein
MRKVIQNPLDCILWQKLFAAKYDGIGSIEKQDFDQLLGHCQVR